MPELPRIGVVMGSNHALQRMARGVAEYVRAAPPRHSFTIVWQVNQEQRTLRHWRGEGIIGMFRGSRTGWLTRAPFKVVNTSSLERSRFPSVLVDDLAVGRIACEHLLERGFRHLGFVGVPGIHYAQLRWQGFSAAAQRAGLRASLFEFGTQRPVHRGTPATFRRLAHWLDQQHTPVGIMAATDPFAPLVLEACNQLGLRLPADVALVGTDNDPTIAELLTPTLTSVDTDMERLGFEAARLMVRLLRGQSAQSSPLMIPPRAVVCRQSTQTFAHGDAHVTAALQAIWGRSDQSIRVDDLLPAAGCSRRTLETRFQRFLGRSPLQEIQRARVERVKRHLLETDRSIAQIATDCGYSYVAQLTAAFKRHAGMTPGAYRQAARGPLISHPARADPKRP